MAELITCRSGVRARYRPAADTPTGGAATLPALFKLAFTSYWRRATSDPDGLSIVLLAADTLGASPPAKLFARE
jgi:hypothetical protein